MTQHCEACTYLVRDPSVSRTLEFEVGQRVTIVGEEGLQALDTYTVGKLTGHRKLGEIDPVGTTVPEFAQRFGYQSFAELPNYLKSVWAAMRGDVENAEFYAREARLGEEEIEAVRSLAGQIKNVQS